MFLIFSSYIASGSYDKTVIIYRTCDASTLHHLTGHLKSVESVRFSHCSTRLCSSSWDRTGNTTLIVAAFLLPLPPPDDSLRAI